jgi:hypothetical protein
VVGQDASPVGCSSPLGVEWGFAARLGVVVAHIVVEPTEGRMVLGDVFHCHILSSI